MELPALLFVLAGKTWNMLISTTMNSESWCIVKAKIYYFYSCCISLNNLLFLTFLPILGITFSKINLFKIFALKFLIFLVVSSLTC